MQIICAFVNSDSTSLLYSFKFQKAIDTTEVKSKINKEVKVEQLEDVFLSLSLSKSLKRNIPEQIEVLDYKKLNERFSFNSADILSSTPGIKVQKSQFGGGSPVIRGMEANRILLMVDGVRMNNAIYRKGHLQNSITISPSQLDRVEVVYGPSSVIYDSDAMGGVIHYYTRKIKVNSALNTFKHKVISGYSSVNNSKTISFNYEYNLKKIGLMGNFSFSKFEDLKMGENRKHGYYNWGKVYKYSDNSYTFYNDKPLKNSNNNLQKNTGYSQKDFIQKIFIPIGSKRDLTLNFQYSSASNIPRFDKLSETKGDGSLKFALWNYGQQDRVLVSAKWEVQKPTNWIETSRTILAYQNLKESRENRKFGDESLNINKEEVDVFSFNSDFSTKLWFNTKLDFGVQLIHNEVSSEARKDILNIEGNNIIGVLYSEEIETRYPSKGSSYSSVSSYGSLRSKINNNSTLNIGLRATMINLKSKWKDDTFSYKESIDLNNKALTFSLGYTYMPKEDLVLKAILSSGFRAPNIDDIGKVREKNGILTVPNSKLKPEHIYNAEFSIIKKSKDRKTNFGVNAYFSVLNNYIGKHYYDVETKTVVPDDYKGEMPSYIYDGELMTTIANVNRGKSYTTGFTAFFDVNIINEVYLKGDITYTEGLDIDYRTPLSSIPPIFGKLDLAYKLRFSENIFSVKYNGSKTLEYYNVVEGIDNHNQLPIVNGEYQKLPSWITYNFYSNFEINKDINLKFSVENIADLHYKEFASGISSPGLNLSVSIGFSF